jgi:hypothetical protein
MPNTADAIPVLHCLDSKCEPDSLLRPVGPSTAAQSQWECPHCKTHYCYYHKSKKLVASTSSTHWNWPKSR